MDDNLTNYNLKHIDVDHIAESGSTNDIAEQMQRIMHGVQSGQYSDLAGDLIALNRNTNEVDIIRLNLRNEEQSTVPSFLGVSRVGFENNTESLIAFDELGDTLGLAVCAVPFEDGQEGVSHYKVVTGYEEFAADVFNLIPAEEKEDV